MLLQVTLESNKNSAVCNRTNVILVNLLLETKKRVVVGRDRMLSLPHLPHLLAELINKTNPTLLRISLGKRVQIAFAKVRNKHVLLIKSSIEWINHNITKVFSNSHLAYVGTSHLGALASPVIQPRFNLPIMVSFANRDHGRKLVPFSFTMEMGIL